MGIVFVVPSTKLPRVAMQPVPEQSDLLMPSRALPGPMYISSGGVKLKSRGSLVTMGRCIMHLIFEHAKALEALAVQYGFSSSSSGSGLVHSTVLPSDVVVKVPTVWVMAL